MHLYIQAELIKTPDSFKWSTLNANIEYPAEGALQLFIQGGNEIMVTET